MFISKQLSCRSVGSFDLPQLQFYCSHKHGEQNGRQVYPIVVFYPSMGFYAPDNNASKISFLKLLMEKFRC